MSDTPPTARPARRAGRARRPRPPGPGRPRRRAWWTTRDLVRATAVAHRVVAKPSPRSRHELDRDGDRVRLHDPARYAPLADRPGLADPVGHLVDAYSEAEAELGRLVAAAPRPAPTWTTCPPLPAPRCAAPCSSPPGSPPTAPACSVSATTTSPPSAPDPGGPRRRGDRGGHRRAHARLHRHRRGPARSEGPLLLRRPAGRPAPGGTRQRRPGLHRPALHTRRGGTVRPPRPGRQRGPRTTRMLLAYGASETTPALAARVQRRLTRLHLAIEALWPDFNRYLGAEAIGAASDLYVLRATARTPLGRAEETTARIYSQGAHARESAATLTAETARRVWADTPPEACVGDWPGTLPAEVRRVPLDTWLSTPAPARSAAVNLTGGAEALTERVILASPASDLRRRSGLPRPPGPRRRRTGRHCAASSAPAAPCGSCAASRTRGTPSSRWARRPGPRTKPPTPPPGSPTACGTAPTDRWPPCCVRASSSSRPAPDAPSTRSGPAPTSPRHCRGWPDTPCWTCRCTASPRSTTHCAGSPRHCRRPPGTPAPEHTNRGRPAPPAPRQVSLPRSSANLSPRGFTTPSAGYVTGTPHHPVRHRGHRHRGREKPASAGPVV